MTDKLYSHDAYAREMDATVVESGEGGVVLDRTVFYATGGGQPGDTGALTWHGGEARVVDVRTRGDSVAHVLDGPSPDPGTDVHGAIDWERRHLLMRTHSALHVLCGIVWRDHGAAVTGGNMAPGEARMDFELATWDPPAFSAAVQQRLDEEIRADRAIEVRHLPRDEAFAIPDLIRTKVNLLPPGIAVVRVVDIVGLDLQADGGTHVRSTAEIGSVRVTKTESKGKANKRLRITVGGAMSERLSRAAR